MFVFQPFIYYSFHILTNNYSLQIWNCEVYSTIFVEQLANNIKSIIMKSFIYKFYIRTNGQEFNTGGITINARCIDEANDLLSRKDLPFHHFSTVEISK